MTAISIPKALAQMDGIFGYKVVTENKSNGKSKTSFVKKNLLDWVYDIVFKLEKMPQTRVKTIGALKQIAEQIKGADDGQFSALVETYANNHEPIDYARIREVLRTSLEYHPPRVYSRPALIPNGNKAGNDVPLIEKGLSHNACRTSES